MVTLSQLKTPESTKTSNLFRSLNIGKEEPNTGPVQAHNSAPFNNSKVEILLSTH